MGFGVAAIGQLSSFDHAGMQPSERPLQFGTCRKGNSHNSALCGAPHKADYVDRTIMWNGGRRYAPNAGMSGVTRILATHNQSVFRKAIKESGAR